jgi:predicted kinase
VFVVSISGAQATGKTTLARATGEALSIPVFSRDILMSTLSASGYPVETVEDMQRLSLAGYRLQGALIEQQLSLGQSAIVECVAPEPVRSEWRRIAASHEALLLAVDCVISDVAVHKERLELRERSGKRGWRRIEWSEVEATLATLPAPGPDTVVADAVDPVVSNVEHIVSALTKRDPGLGLHL